MQRKNLEKTYDLDMNNHLTFENCENKKPKKPRKPKKNLEKPKKNLFDTKPFKEKLINLSIKCQITYANHVGL